MASVVISGDTSGAITLSAPAVAGTTTLTLPATSGTVLQSGTTVTEAQGGTGTTIGYNGFKNRIINGAMVIDQRNAGASVSISSVFATYTLDRWASFNSVTGKLTVQQSSTVPTGFNNSANLTCSSAYTASSAESFHLTQYIEGYNVADLGWGTANAKTITLSFWVRSSLTGTFSGSLQNASNDRTYAFTYTISVADTWEYKTVTVAGDTTGTWLTTNGRGISLRFNTGSGSDFLTSPGSWGSGNYVGATGSVSLIGTLNATWYVTGVQLEKGSTATSFDYRPYGTELALCQRYYEKSYNMASIAGASTNTGKGSFVCATGNTFWRWTQNYRVSKRADSTFTIYSTTGASGNVRLSNGSDLAVSTEDAGENATAVFVSRNATVGDFFWWQWTASAEL
jgi:hypothetical protein